MKTSIFITALFFTGFTFAQQQKPTDSIKSENAKEIETVTIKKQVFKKLSDRFVYDVAASSIAKGNTTFDVLKQTPLVSSTDDENLKIAGKNNAIIYINGRKSNMDAKSLAQFLKNTPAENIQKIEVITMPGSEYQVESSEGIINIILKKKMTDGLNGNMRMANAQNKFNSTSASLSLNYRKDKLGISTNIITSQNIQAKTYLVKNGNDLSSNESYGDMNEPNKDLGGYLNADYQLNDNSNLALSWNFWANKTDNMTMDFFNTTKAWNEKKNQYDFYYSKTQNRTDTRSFNNSLNLNYELKTDTLGSKLNLNVAYLHFKRNQNSINRTIVSDEFQNEFGVSKIIDQDLPQIINNISGTVDYIKKFKNDFDVSIGGNYNHTKTDNDTKNETYFLIPPDKTKSEPNHFIYNENIYGAYLTFQKKFSDKLSGKIGTRYEITNSLGTSDNAQNPDYKRIERSYNKLLPYLSVNYAINDKNNISYSFSSRMRRPSFWEINPVKLILTDDNYTQNNPFVKASTNYNQELTYMYKNSYFFIVNHSIIKDRIAEVPLQRDVVKADGLTYKQLRYIRTNFGDGQEMSAMLGLQKNFFKQYLTINFNIGLLVNKNDGSLSVDPTTGDVFPTYTNTKSSTGLLIQSNNSIRLDKAKTWFMGVNYLYVAKQQIEIGVLQPLSNLDLSIKKLWNNWTFQAEVKDVFKTFMVEIEDNQANGNNNYLRNNQYKQSANVSITYNFGNQKVKKIRDIDNAADAIKNRTN